MATDHCRPGPTDEVPFWRRKSLEEMTDSEWESLCDGCGKCCLNKLEEEGTDRTLLHRCRLPAARRPDAAGAATMRTAWKRSMTASGLRPETLKTITWLPPSCAYVLLAKGKDLYWWHPLVSGDPETVHSGGRLCARARACQRDPRFRRYA